MPPHTTKRRATKNDENCQKIKLYGSLTTKELKKKHSSRPVGWVETDRQAKEDTWQGSHWRIRQARWQLEDQVRWQLVDWVVPHLHVDKLGGTTGEPDRPHNLGFQLREIKPQNL